MLKLIFQHLDKRRTQSISVFLAILLSVSALFALFLLYSGVSKGMEISSQRMGADILVVPSDAESMAEERDLLFTGAPASIYMPESIEGQIRQIKGVKRTTVQFYGQTLGSSCCSTGAERRIVGYDGDTDWLIKPWADKEINGRLGQDEVIIGCDVGGFETGTGFLLGHKMKLAACLEPTGTSLDSCIFVDLDVARGFSKAQEGYDHFWEKYGQPEHLISAVAVETEEGSRTAAANMIELKGDFKCITSSHVLGEIQEQMKVLFLIMLGAGILLSASSVFQLFARFYSMAWDRKAELGLYRAMGASKKDLKLLILGEAMLLTGTGAAAGLGAGVGLYKLLLALMLKEQIFPFLAPSPLQVLLGILLCLAAFLLAACLSAMTPLHQISRIDPSAAMQKQDID